MKVEDVPMTAWLDIVRGKRNLQFESLAVQIFLGRVRLVTKTDTDPSTFSKLADELRELFIQSANLPTFQQDLSKL